MHVRKEEEKRSALDESLVCLPMQKVRSARARGCRVCLASRTNGGAALCMMPVAVDQWRSSLGVCMTDVPWK